MLNDDNSFGQAQGVLRFTTLVNGMKLGNCVVTFDGEDASDAIRGYTDGNGAQECVVQ